MSKYEKNGKNVVITPYQRNLHFTKEKVFQEFLKKTQNKQPQKPGRVIMENKYYLHNFKHTYCKNNKKNQADAGRTLSCLLKYQKKKKQLPLSARKPSPLKNLMVPKRPLTSPYSQFQSQRRLNAKLQKTKTGEKINEESPKFDIPISFPSIEAPIGKTKRRININSARDILMTERSELTLYRKQFEQIFQNSLATSRNFERVEHLNRVDSDMHKMFHSVESITQNAKNFLTLSSTQNSPRYFLRTEKYGGSDVHTPILKIKDIRKSQPVLFQTNL